MTFKHPVGINDDYGLESFVLIMKLEFVLAVVGWVWHSMVCLLAVVGWVWHSMVCLKLLFIKQELTST